MAQPVMLNGELVAVVYLGHFLSEVTLNEFAGMMKLNSNYLGEIIKNSSDRTFRPQLRNDWVRDEKLLLSVADCSPATSVND